MTWDFYPSGNQRSRSDDGGAEHYAIEIGDPPRDVLDPARDLREVGIQALGRQLEVNRGQQRHGAGAEGGDRESPARAPRLEWPGSTGKGHLGEPTAGGPAQVDDRGSETRRRAARAALGDDDVEPAPLHGREEVPAPDGNRDAVQCRSDVGNLQLSPPVSWR